MKRGFQGLDYDEVYAEIMQSEPNIGNSERYSDYIEAICDTGRTSCKNKDEVVDMCEGMMNGALVRGYSYDCHCEFTAAYDVRAFVLQSMKRRRF